jgi:hypothetical protein
VQIVAYASRVLQLAGILFGERAAGLELQFVQRLKAAKSNLPREQDGALVYDRRVRPMQVGLEQVAAHYAISSIFTNYPDEANLFCYTVRRIAYEAVSSGRVRLVMGQALISSRITEAAETAAFAVLHFGDQNITAVVKRWDAKDAPTWELFVEEVKEAANRADFPEVVRCFDRYFGPQAYSIGSLFHDEQKRILEILLRSTVSEVETTLSNIYEKQASLLHFLSQSGLPQPEALTLAATFAINAGLKRALESDPIDAVQTRNWLNLAKADQVALDKPVLSYAVDQRMKRAMVELHEQPENGALDNALLVARTIRELPIELNLWQAQNLWYELYRARRDSPPSEEWLQKLKDLGRLLHILVEDIVSEEGNGNGERAAVEKTETAVS